MIRHGTRVLGLAAGVALCAWQAGAAEKVAVVLSRSVAPYLEAAKGLQQEASFETVAVNLEGDLAGGRKIMSRYQPAQIRVVVPIGTEAVLTTRELNAEIPIVYTMIMDPPVIPNHEAGGVVIKIPLDEQFAKIQKMFPNVKRVGVIYNPRYSTQDINQARQLVRQYQLTLHPIAVDDQDKVPDALRKLTADEVDLLWMVADKTVAHPAVVQQLILHAAQENLPLIGLSMYHVKAGALAAFSVDFQDIGAQTADYARRVLAQGMSGEVETPRKIIVYVNPKMQKQLGIEDLSVFPEVKYVQ